MEERVFKLSLDGKEIIVKPSKYCGYTNGSCLVQVGESIVMVNTTMSKAPDVFSWKNSWRIQKERRQG